MLLKKILLMGLTVGLATTLLAACGNEKGTSSKGTGSEMPDKITIVQMPDENNPDAGTKNDAFREAMETTLGIEVEELEGAEYSVGLEALKAGKLDILLVSPMSYYQAKKMADVDPLVTTKTMGADPYKTVFVTQKSRTDINSLEDLKEKTFAFVDPASSSGYMYPKAKLLDALKLDTEQLENPGYFFKTTVFSGKHDTSLMGVAKGDYDAAAVAFQTINMMDKAGLINKDEIKIIDETAEIPNALYVIRQDLPQELKDKIKDFYLQYADEVYFQTFYQDSATRFIEAKDADYAEVEKMVKILKIEEE
ncbi:phosphate/phosphite/phosphonate ABC transporter substrate-binding protein [Paenibacillus senegalimassiliensis]|uniref:phosphate/phosphite/phosphonate ABC transporter substrate-binding protein n=1 Tax=Paenibacillus senegalimassiliensis TaxID=1737426 RepID=UPI00073ED0D9|nr:phosphate/phosphite/phosphonate ABC transporter substrate-binding protein [Paenibacillus senegalimassiliensis]